MSALTAQQHAAVTACGNALVVAGAGTGKTRTLIERCLRLLLQERVSIERLLLVTFTEAAAAEMRHRLREALLQARLQRPDDDHLARQYALLDNARISTLHSFCLQLVREHFHELDLDPQFTVLDEQQIAPLRRAALDAVLERFYAGADATAQAVREMIRLLGRGREAVVRRLVLRIHDYARSLPDPEAWLDEQRRRFEQSHPAELRELWLQAVASWRDEWLAESEHWPSDLPALGTCREALRQLATNPEVETAARVLAALVAVDNAPEGWPRGTKKARKPVAECFDEAAFLASVAPGAGPDDPLQEDWEQTRPHMLALLELTRAFTAEFAARKRELAGLDFADLEQFALRLLRRSPDGAPTPVAQAWRAQLEHILVDEYQDINGAQDAILTALGREGEGNRFLVGDVQQSIYRFRLANPNIFVRYQNQWKQPGGGGRVFPLTENFRSRAAILEFVNALFGALMRPEAGGVDFEPLRSGLPAERATPAPDAPGDRCVEVHLLARPHTAGATAEAEGDAPDEEEDLLATEREARLVAWRLRELRGSGLRVWDAALGAFRPVDWKDMAVLLRAPAGRAEAFAKEFNRAGVPLSAERLGFFSTLEVADLLNLLRLLDNPLQDIPLVAVLRSPLGGFSPDELAQIRAASPAGRFWTALQNCAANEPQGGEQAAPGPAAKAAAFLRQFERWRELLRHTSLSQCLETVLADTHYEALLGAGERGPERAVNVRRLLDLVRQFDPYQRQGLYRFLRFVQSQQDEELDLDAPPLSGENAVRLMSIHKAKGLEFPVVVLAGMGVRFNEQDLHSAVLVHEQLGLCPRVFLAAEQSSYPSLHWWLARRSERRELRAEELRLLYVALTRARDRLILVGTTAARDGAAGLRKKLAQSAAQTDPNQPESERVAPLSTRELLRARSHLDWLLAWLPRLVRAEDFGERDSGTTRLLRWRIVEPDALKTPPPGPEAAVPPCPAPSDKLTAAIETLRQRLDWRYAHLAATTRKAKASVSELRRRALEETDAEAWRVFEPVARSRAGTGRTDGEDAELSAADIGTAHHRFLERLALDRTGDLAALAAEARRLQEQGHLSAAEVNALDLEALAAFWSSDLGRRIRAASGCVHRELAFTARFEPGELDRLLGLNATAPSTGSDAEFVVVQGVADLVVVRPDQLWVVDFKTDAVSDETLEAVTRRYTPQLKLYARALERVYRRPVAECALHFLALRRTIAVPLD